MKHVFVALMACLGAAGFNPASAQPIPSLGEGLIEDYLRHVVTEDRYTIPLLSPSGRYLFLREGYGDITSRNRALIIDLDAPDGALAQRVNLGNFRIEDVVWSSDDYLVLSTHQAATRTWSPQRGSQTEHAFTWNMRTVSVDRERGEIATTLFSSTGHGDVEGAHNGVLDWLPDEPEHVLMMAHRDGVLSVYRVNILTAETVLVEAGNERTVGWQVQNGRAVVRGDVSDEVWRIETYVRAGDSDDWVRSEELDDQDSDADAPPFVWLGEADEPQQALVLARPDGADLVAIYRYDTEAGTFGDLYAQVDGYDIRSGVHDSNGGLVGYAYDAVKREFHWFEEDWRRHLERIRASFDSSEAILPVSIADRRMVIEVTGPRTPRSFYVFEFETEELEHLVDADPHLSRGRLRQMEPLTYTARDGLTLQGYVSYPSIGPGPEVPLVVMPHGGPAVRDVQEFDPVVQYLTAVGYAVFQPNYRGSSGYGRAFTDAGDGEWGRLMQTDIDDGVLHLVSQGVVSAEQICIVGFSYGGYAALMAAVSSPDLYRCAFGAGGVYDLPMALEAEEAASPVNAEALRRKIGDPADDRAAIEAISPAYRADEIAMPVMLMHGTRDGIVSVEQSRRMADALKRAGAAFEYLEVEFGDHNWGVDRDFILAMRNLRAFLDDGIDGQMDGFEITGRDGATNDLGAIWDDYLEPPLIPASFGDPGW